MKKKTQILLKLFVSTLYLSAFTFGGGYVIITLLKEKFVDKLHWIEEEEMLDLVAIAQASPGAVAVNGSIVIGYKLAGIKGVFAAVAGAVLPPAVILSVVSLWYDAFRTNPVISALLSGMTAGVAAVIASAVYDMGSKIVREKQWMNVAVMVISFGASLFFDVNVVLIILTVAVWGVIRTICRERRQKHHDLS